MTIQTLRTSPKYKDFYTSFNVKATSTGRKTGDLYVLTDADAVKASIKALVLTDPYERFFRPKLGGGIKRSLFENISPMTEDIIKTQIEFTIKNYEPRARLIEVYVNAIPDENGYTATIVFSLINSTKQERLDVILYRVR
jgi:phage baseplate assembly protein W